MFFQEAATQYFGWSNASFSHSRTRQVYLPPTLTSPVGARSARVGLSPPAQAWAGQARQGQGRWPPYSDRSRHLALCLEWGHKWGHLRQSRAGKQLGKRRGGWEWEGAGLTPEHRPRQVRGTGTIRSAKEVQAEKTVPVLHPDARAKAKSPGRLCQLPLRRTVPCRLLKGLAALIFGYR